jgi:hypothetical protein
MYSGMFSIPRWRTVLVDRAWSSVLGRRAVAGLPFTEVEEPVAARVTEEVFDSLVV